MTFIPQDAEDDVLARFEGGESAESIHRSLWPRGNPSVSARTLQTILQSMAEERRAQASPPPSDELPVDLGDLLGDLARARALVFDALEAPDEPDPDAPARPPQNVVAACHAARAISDNVKAALAVDKHRRLLQRHRDWLVGGWRTGLRR